MSPFWTKEKTYDVAGYEAQDKAFHASVEAKLSEIKDDPKRQAYVASYMFMKQFVAEGTPLYLVRNLMGAIVHKAMIPLNSSKPASVDITELLDFATVSFDNPEYNNGSLLSRIQPKKISSVKNYAIDIYGELKDSIPDGTDENLFKTIGSYRNVMVGRNLDTGEDGLIVSDEIIELGVPVKSKERFISDKEISYITYEV